MNKDITTLSLPLERDIFLRELLRQLSGTLQDLVGLDEAEGFVSIVGQKIGESINNDYRAALQVKKLNREQLSSVLVDLKQRIQGDFTIVSEDDNKSVIKGASCPSAIK